MKTTMKISTLLIALFFVTGENKAQVIAVNKSRLMTDSVIVSTQKNKMKAVPKKGKSSFSNSNKFNSYFDEADALFGKRTTVKGSKKPTRPGVSSSKMFGNHFNYSAFLIAHQKNKRIERSKRNRKAQ